MERSWLEGKTVGDFLGLENAAARGRMLLEASEREDGTYTVSDGKALSLAVTLFARLRRGVRVRGEACPPPRILLCVHTC